MVDEQAGQGYNGMPIPTTATDKNYEPPIPLGADRNQMSAFIRSVEAKLSSLTVDQKDFFRDCFIGKLTVDEAITKYRSKVEAAKTPKPPRVSRKYDDWEPTKK
jgi:hypothetical protein